MMPVNLSGMLFLVVATTTIGNVAAAQNSARIFEGAGTPRVALSWESTMGAHPERAAWSNYLTGLIWKNLSTYEKAADVAFFCPKWATLEDEQKVKAVGELWVSTAFFESGFKVASQSVDVGTKDQKDTWSVGLFQMSVVDQKNYGFKYGLTFADLITAIPNIRLAHAVMMKQLIAGHLMVVSSHPYWATLFRGKYSKVDEIRRAVLKQAPKCD